MASTKKKEEESNRKDNDKVMKKLYSICKAEPLKVQIRESVKGAAIVGITTVVGGLVLGPVGIIGGSIIGGLVGASVSNVRTIIEVFDDLNSEEISELVATIMKHCSISSVEFLIAIMDNPDWKAVILDAVKIFLIRIGLEIMREGVSSAMR